MNILEAGKMTPEALSAHVRAASDPLSHVITLQRMVQDKKMTQETFVAQVETLTAPMEHMLSLQQGLGQGKITPSDVDAQFQAVALPLQTIRSSTQLLNEGTMTPEQLSQKVEDLSKPLLRARKFQEKVVGGIAKQEDFDIQIAAVAAPLQRVQEIVDLLIGGKLNEKDFERQLGAVSGPLQRIYESSKLMGTANNAMSAAMAAKRGIENGSWMKETMGKIGMLQHEYVVKDSRWEVAAGYVDFVGEVYQVASSEDAPSATLTSFSQWMWEGDAESTMSGTVQGMSKFMGFGDPESLKEQMAGGGPSIQGLAVRLHDWAKSALSSNDLEDWSKEGFKMLGEELRRVIDDAQEAAVDGINDVVSKVQKDIEDSLNLPVQAVLINGRAPDLTAVTRTCAMLKATQQLLRRGQRA
jgi:hypothetical protein